MSVSGEMCRSISLSGGAGDDSLTGGAGHDTFYCDAGTDMVTDLSNGDDLVVSNNATANVTITSTFKATAVTCNYYVADLSSAGFAVNLANATGYYGYTVINTGAAATFTGSSKGDLLQGGTGNDTLTGGAALDQLTGGAGSDTFLYSSLNDILTGGTSAARNVETITDFLIGTDILDGPGGTRAIKNLGATTALSDTAIKTFLSKVDFAAGAAATFTYDSGDALRTFVALNDSTSGFDAAKDGFFEITGYSGNLAALKIV